ncbi:hypothetical protein TNCT_176061 [Trichonephila clavata]|uniref:Uncharacterized protein n=1 Tax=Trichonephila clavata TaxID=2740835 RepID=A0A8X6HJ67_TRICU|nr:hypothetical protein TNCT_176061 [Trichonephila clavata]
MNALYECYEASHKAQGMEEATLNLFEELKLDLKNWRGQSYEKAPNMSGVFSGLQSIIRGEKMSLLSSYHVQLIP